MGQLSLKYIGPKLWSDISENLKSLSPYSFGKQYENVLPAAILRKFLLIFGFVFSFSVILF